jgi:hypothetical protein
MIPYPSTTQARVSPPTLGANKCEARFSSQPPIVWAIFRCPRGAFGWKRMQFTNPSKHACMAITFCRWFHSDVKVKGGTVATIRWIPTILCWMWTYSECEKNKSHGVQLCWPMPKVRVWRWCYWTCVDLQIPKDPIQNHPKRRLCNGTFSSYQ